MPDPPAQPFGPCSTASLLCERPRLLSCTALRHPCKLLVLLRNSEVPHVRGFLDSVPEEVARSILCHLLKHVERRCFFEVLAPLLNSAELHSAAAALLVALDAQHVVEVVSCVPFENLAVVLSAGTAPLVAVISAVEADRLAVVLVPLLQEPVAVLRGTLVPILQLTRHPERLAAFANLLELSLVLQLLRGVEAVQIAALLDALEPNDLGSEGTMMVLLKEAAEDVQFVDEKILPLLRHADLARVVLLLRGVEATKLMHVLRGVDIEGLLRLIQHADPGFVVKLLNGPVNQIVASLAGEHAMAKLARDLALVLRSPFAAQAVSRTTKTLNAGLMTAGQVCGKPSDRV